MKKKLLVMVPACLAVLLCAGSALADLQYYCSECEQDVTPRYEIIDASAHKILCDKGHNLGTVGHDFTGANCRTKGKCVCGAESAYGDHSWNISYEWSTDNTSCTATRICSVCLNRETQEAKVEVDDNCTLDGYTIYTATFSVWGEDQEKKVYTGVRRHSWSFTEEWAEDYSSCYVTAVCKNDSRHTYAGTATNIEHYVSSPAKCKDKEEGWFRHAARVTIEGKDYQITKEIPIPYTHDYQLISTAENGDKTYTCSSCGDTYTEKHEHNYKLASTKNGDKTYTCTLCGDSYTKKHTHWYGEWSYADDGKHTAECKIDGCKHTGKVACETFEYTLNDETFTLCPVCGHMDDDTRLELVEEATATGEALPKGELVLRENGELMSVGFEYAGKLTQPTKPVTVTLPAEAVEGYTLSILNADGTETALETTADGESISFTLDFGEAKVVLIHMVAAA